jgi:hypothetical protein
MVLGGEVARSWPSGRLVWEVPVGFAAVAAVHAGHESTEPTVRAVLLGVQRADGKLVAADLRMQHRTHMLDEAQREAWRALADQPSLRYAGRQAGAAVKAFERHRASARALPPPRLPWPDPVERWRKLVGDRRAERIGARADQLGEQVSKVSFEELILERRALRAKFTSGDSVVARRALSLERDLDKHEEEMYRAHRDIASLQADAARAGAPERARLIQAVNTIERRIALDEIVHHAMRTNDRRRAARDRLDSWMIENGEQVVRMVAIDREALNRLYRRSETVVARARDDPPDYVRNAIGKAPQASSPEHDAWVATTRRLVYAHHAEAANRAAGYELVLPDARERRALEATIERQSVGPDIAA